jgi:hypothetical protein
MPEKPYDHNQIELKWYERWKDATFYKAEENSALPKYYVLEMLPYPSGTLHIGHIRNYSIGDALARYKWMRGYNVLHPMGWDAFGLPAENAAIANKRPPREWTLQNIAAMKQTHRRFAFSYDWDREVSTCEPEYYRWNQWFFLRMLERGLAYRKKALVNWCPKCATVLANEQVVDGCCWRHDTTPVEQRALEQWFLRITEYADELLRDIAQLEGGWPERVRPYRWYLWAGWHTAECRFDPTQQIVRPKVADRDGDRVVWHIVTLIPGIEIFPGDGMQIARPADDSLPVGMDLERGGGDLFAEVESGIVLAAFALGEDDCPLGVNLGRIEDRVDHPVGFNLECEVEPVAWERLEVRRVVDPREPVEGAAVLGNVAKYLPLLEGLGALEEHMLDPVRDAG